MGNVLMGIIMLVVGVGVGAGITAIGFVAAKKFAGIINVWSNWRTLPFLILFWLVSTGLIIGGIVVLTHPENQGKHASIRRTVEGPTELAFDDAGDCGCEDQQNAAHPLTWNYIPLPRLRSFQLL